MVTINSCDYATGAVGTVLTGNGVGVTPTFQPGSGFTTTLTSVDTSVHLNHVGNNYDLSSISVTPFIVGAVLGEECNYTSIQTAIDDAFAAGGGVVFIRAKTSPYVEDLTLKANVQLVGAQADGRPPTTANLVVIQGNHTFTPPVSALAIVFFDNIYFVTGTAGNLFTMSGIPSGSAAVLGFKYCNLDASTGTSVAVNLDSPAGAAGIVSIYNSNGSSTGDFIVETGAGNTLTLIFDSQITGGTNCFSLGAASGLIELVSSIIQANSGVVLQFNATTNAVISYCELIASDSVIDFLASSSAVEFFHNIVTSSNPSGYWAKGTGNIAWADVGFGVGATNLDPAVTSVPHVWQPYGTAGTSLTATAGTASFDNAFFNVTNGFVTLTTPPGSLIWNNVAGTSQTMVANNGYQANAGTLTTFTLPTTAAQFTQLAIIGSGSCPWTIAQNTGQNIQFSSLSTTVGGGGSLSSNDNHDTVYLQCTVADTTWTVTHATGTLTVV